MSRKTAILALLGLCFLAFWPFLLADLFWDDFLVIRPDGPIASLSTLSIAFFGRCVLFGEAYSYPYYRPLIDSLFVLEYAIAGTGPLLYHLTNFVLHTANAILFFELLRRLAGRSNPEIALPAVFLGTGIFALHPIQVESVLWPAARPAVLCTFFVLLSLHAYIRMRCLEVRATIRILSAMGCVVGFVAALFSKEIAIAVIPPALLLLLARDRRVSRMEWAVIASLCVALVAYLVFNAAIGGSASTLGELSPVAILLKAATFFGFYLSKLIVPLNLAPAYPTAYAEGVVYTALGLAGGLTLVGIFLWGLVQRTGVSLLAAAAAAFFGGGAILPLLGGQLTVADRYVYQAMLGLAVLVALGVGRLTMGKNTLMPMLAIPAFLALLSMRQSTFWISSEGLWEHVVAVAPDSVEGNFYVAQAAARRGESELATSHFERATYPESESSSVARFDAAFELANLYMDAGRFADAEQALAFAASYPPYRTDALARTAISASIAGNTERALGILASIEPVPGDPARVYTTLALLEWRLAKDRDAALARYEKARSLGAGPIDELEALLRE